MLPSIAHHGCSDTRWCRSTLRAVPALLCLHDANAVCMFHCQIFPSTVQYGRGFWISLWLSLALFFICLFVAAGEDKPMQTYIVAGAFSLL